MGILLKRSLGLVCLLAQATSAATFYVDVNSTNATPPFVDWSTAATNIQDAIDAASAGDQVLVNDGIYSTGGGPVNNSAETNRVAVNKPVTVQSVNGPAVTVIEGDDDVRCVYLADGATLSGFTLTNGTTAGSGGGVWCESISATVSNCVITGNYAQEGGGGASGGTLNNSTLTGNWTYWDGGGADGCTLNNCTLTGNFAWEAAGAWGCMLNNCTLTNNEAWFGGGGAASSMLNNCTLTGNRGHDYGGGADLDCTLNNCSVSNNSGGPQCMGGGAWRCTLNNCTLTGNSAELGGGADFSTLNNCTLTGNLTSWAAGGALDCTLNNCTLTGNSASFGGGALDCTLNNCTLSGNSATYYGNSTYTGHGGGAENCTLNNCTLTGNSATDDGGGAYSSTLNNCIVYFNSDPLGGNYDPSCTLNYCCTIPMPTNGVGNITNAPLFMDFAGGNLRLQSNSPCINAGNNAYAPSGSDLDGNLRIVGGTVDIGAYEFQTPASAISYARLQQCGLPTDGSADYLDSDGDGMNNWQEWIAGTDPTDALSLLRLLPPPLTGTNMTVSWQSVAGVTYFLERSTNLVASPCFTCVATNLPGQPGTTIYTDTNAVESGQFYYRVGVGR